tara:strand:+ start:2871 stop:3650 length:780 start_codon:yes stop_codon:yes gene_type:complete
MRLLISILAAALLTHAMPAWSASFDCNKASTDAEIAICNDPELSALDELMGFTYKQYLTYESWLSFEKNKSKVIQIQRDWIHQRDKCQSNTLCLFKQYQKQIFFLFDEINDDDSVIVGLTGLNNLDVNNIQYLTQSLPYLETGNVIRAATISDYKAVHEKGVSKYYLFMAIMVSENDPEKIYSSASGNVRDQNPTDLIVLRSSRESPDWKEVCFIELGVTAREWSSLFFNNEELFLRQDWMRHSETHLLSKVTHRGCSN